MKKLDQFKNICKELIISNEMTAFGLQREIDIIKKELLGPDPNELTLFGCYEFSSKALNKFNKKWKEFIGFDPKDATIYAFKVKSKGSKFYELVYANNGVIEDAGTDFRIIDSMFKKIDKPKTKPKISKHIINNLAYQLYAEHDSKRIAQYVDVI